MGLYEAAKDALTVAQKADNIELVQKLLDVQKMALDMQEKQQEQHQKIIGLEKEIESLKDASKYTFAKDGNWIVDPKYPERKLCPLCTKKHGTPVPLDGSYCRQCKGIYE